MNLQPEIKQKIRQALADRKENYPSVSRMATVLGVDKSQLSRFIGGETERVISDSSLINIARRMGIELRQQAPWQTARTDVFNYIWRQLELCQMHAVGGIYCDVADIGKTYTARHYARTQQNVAYIDCSQVKNKQRFTRAIAREFGVDHQGRYADIYADLVYYINGTENPLIILDEAGDLDYGAWLEVKALWNATAHACGWYMMGADGLKVKIERQRDAKKVGYAEIFSRFGNRYQRIQRNGKKEEQQFRFNLVAQVAKANGADNPQELYARTEGGSLRRVYLELNKQKSNIPLPKGTKGEEPTQKGAQP